MTIEECESRLERCREELRASTERLSLSKPEDLASWEVWHQKCLDIERELARLNAEEAAQRLEWPIVWDVGAPVPQVMSGNGRTFLLYYVADILPGLDPSSARVLDTEESVHDAVALVEFLSCYEFRFGGPTDDDFQRHPLYGRGLDLYQAHTVDNSRLLEEAREISRHDGADDPERWARFKHFVLLFHDESFECLAPGYYIEVYRREFDDVLGIALNRMTGREKWRPRRASRN